MFDVFLTLFGRRRRDWWARVDRQIFSLHERLNKMATIDDLDAAVATLQGDLAANDTRVAAVAQAVSDAAAHAAAHDADLDAQIKALQAEIAAGNTDPVALQTAVDKIAALSTESVAQGQSMDAATTALAAAFPTPATP